MNDSASVISDDLAQYPHVPLYYILSRDVTPEQETAVHDAVLLTPIYFGIVTTIADSPLASRFAPTVLQVANDAAALALAQQFYDESQGHDNRSIIIGTADILSGVYPDRTANIPCL